MIEVSSYEGEGFKVLHLTDGFKVGYLKYNKRFSEYKELERHNESDESFVLLRGSATLYTESERVEMKERTLYNIPTGEWHHITVSPDGEVLVIERHDVSKDNSEHRYF